MPFSFQVIAPGAPTSGPQLLAVLNAMSEFKDKFGVTARDAAFMRNISMVSEGQISPEPKML